MTEYDERVFEEKAERHFQGQRELPHGRDYRWNTFRFISKVDRANYRKNFSKIFPNAPGSFLDAEE